MKSQLIMSIKRILPRSFFFLGLVTVVLSQHTAGKSHKRETYACEGQTLKISCGGSSDGQNNQRIRVLRANYGRFSIALCNPNGVVGWSTKCMSATSTQVLIERCAEKASCSVDVADKTFGDDPCPGTDKYLEVHYECTSDVQTTIPEPQSFLPATSLPSVFQSRVFAVTTTTPTTTTSTTPTTPTPTTPTTTTPSTPSTTITLPIDPITEEYLIASSTSDEATIKPVQTRSRHQPVQSKQSSSNQVTEFCSPVLRNNIMWPKTPKGATAFEMCPRESKSYAEWSCDDQSPPQWRGLPDLSQCTSQWIDGFRREAGSDVPAEKVAENFAKQTAKETFSSGWDMANAVEIIGKLVGRGSKGLARVSDDEEHDVSVQKLGENVLKAGSNLLDGRHNASWEELGVEAKAQTATNLLNSLESTAFMLAENVPVGTILTSSDRNIVMGAGKLQTKTLAQSYRFPVNEEQFSKEKISKSNIEFPAATLQQYSQDNIVKVVFLSFNNAGGYLSSEVSNKKIFNGEYTVNSKVITASLSNGQHKGALKENVVITLEHMRPMLPGQKGVCAFWEHGVNKKDKAFVGRWSTEGCEVVSQNADQTVCNCSHLTSFAVLVDVPGTPVYSSSLSNITLIGCSISIICLFLTLVVLCSVRSLQNERSTIHNNLAFSLLAAEVFFLAGITQTHLPVGCHIFSAFMHFFFLATFMWCLFDGLHLYLLLVEVFESEKSRRTWYYLAGYGIPLIIVAVCLGVDWTSYATAEYCWLRADNYFILGFVIPVGLIVIANLFFLSVALYFMCRSIGLKSALHARDPATYKQLKMWICGAFGLVAVMAVTWIFGFMYLGNLETVIFAYVFTFFNSFQGVLIFFLVCFKNEKVRTSMRQLTTSLAERLSRCFCTRPHSMYSANNGPSTDGPSFYQSAPPLDKEQQYITSNYPAYWHTQLARPTDISRRSTVTSTLPPHSPPVPQCTCEHHDYPLHTQHPTATIEKTSSRSSNRDSGHESASCPSADSPPMHPTHIHQRTLYPPSFVRKSMCSHALYNPRLQSRNARIYYGDVEHIYAEIESQHACMDEQCPYSDASDESNTSVYHRTGSDVSTDDDRCHHLTTVTVDEEGRVVPVFHSLEQKPLIKSLGPNNTMNMQHCQRHCEVRSAFRSLAKPNAHAKLRQAAKNQPVIFSNALAETGPYVNTMLDGSSGGNYNAFGLTSLRDGSQMVRRLPLMAKSAQGSVAQGPVPFSEC